RSEAVAPRTTPASQGRRWRLYAGADGSRRDRLHKDAALRCLPGEAALHGAAREARARAACTATQEGGSAEKRHLAAAAAPPAGSARTQARRGALGRSLDFPGGEPREICRASA